MTATIATNTIITSTTITTAAITTSLLLLLLQLLLLPLLWLLQLPLLLLYSSFITVRNVYTGISKLKYFKICKSQFHCILIYWKAVCQCCYLRYILSCLLLTDLVHHSHELKIWRQKKISSNKQVTLFNVYLSFRNSQNSSWRVHMAQTFWKMGLCTVGSIITHFCPAILQCAWL